MLWRDLIAPSHIRQIWMRNDMKCMKVRLNRSHLYPFFKPLMKKIRDSISLPSFPFLFPLYLWQLRESLIWWINYQLSTSKSTSIHRFLYYLEVDFMWIWWWLLIMEGIWQANARQMAHSREMPANSSIIIWYQGLYLSYLSISQDRDHKYWDRKERLGPCYIYTILAIFSTVDSI